MASSMGNTAGFLKGGVDDFYNSATKDMNAEQELEFDSLLGNIMAKGGSPNSSKAQGQYGQAPDMSQSSNIMSLLNMSNSMPKQAPARQQAVNTAQLDAYIKSLLGG